MNNFSSFLDAPGPNMPRTAPSPSPSTAVAQAHQNGLAGGMGGGQPNGGSIPLVNGLPSGGQQTDMNHLWQVVQQLSQALEENRQQTAGIMQGVQAIQTRATEEGGLGNLAVREVNGEADASHTTTIQTLTAQLSTARSQISALTSSNTALTSLVTDYENALSLLLDKLRPYAYTQTQSALAVHKHYQELLEKERANSMQVRLEHAEWQAGLSRVAEYARGALKAQSEADLPYKSEIKALKEENRVLRRLAGWEERADSSDEDEQEKAQGQ